MRTRFMRCSVRCIFKMGAGYETVNPPMNISMLIIIIYASVFFCFHLKLFSDARLPS